MPSVLAIDLGTSSVKVVVVSDDGRVTGRGFASYPTQRPSPGAAEQDPNQWWDATVAAARTAIAASKVDPGTITAIGLTGQMHGTVLTDAAGRPVRPAIIWSDARGSDAASRIEDTIGREAIAATTGGPLASGFQGVTLRWLADQASEDLARARHVLLPKDWLRLRMTGTVATDPSDAGATGLFDIRRDEWSADLIAATGADPRTLPAVRASSDPAGELAADVALALGLPAGLPVVAGAGDAPAAALGAGVTTPGQLLVTLSTGTQAYLPVASPDDGSGGQIVRTALRAGPGGWARMAATLNTGSALRWATTALGFPDERALLRAAWDAPAGANGVLFLPHLGGERAPWYDAGARGAFIGLASDHGQTDLARAVLEGVTLAGALAWDTIDRTGLPEPAELTLAGGGAADPDWCQLVADVYGLPVQPSTDPDQSVRGAAILALAMSGNADPATITADLSPSPGSRLIPNPRRHGLYRERLAVLADAYLALRDVTGRLRRSGGVEE
ncbi:MAG TPA: xylulokinase [Thermomicrobiales bacterium]|jgi:xylulokinase|nr:xylulokinase [Thermomicrobiales bacterium]